MKIIYYKNGPAKLAAGQAGEFKRGLAKPVSDKLSDALLARKDILFSVSKSKDKLDPDLDIEALKQAAIEQDKKDQAAAASEKKETEALQPAEEPKEVTNNV